LWCEDDLRYMQPFSNAALGLLDGVAGKDSTAGKVP
jgi:hypothetical protein